MPTHSERVADLKKRQPKETAAVIEAKVRKTERLRTLVDTQGGIIEGNSTVKRIVPNQERRGRGYDPFGPVEKAMKEAMLSHYKICPGAGRRKTPKTAIEFPLRFWWYDFLSQQEWLVDTHIDAVIYMLRMRMLNHPEWFRSDRICFVDTTFGHYWSTKYEEFNMIEPDESGFGRALPLLSFDYYKGLLPEPQPSLKIWGVDIDDLYIPYNLKATHWVALYISLPKRHITVYDSLPHYTTAAELDSLIEPVAVMLPYMMRLLADNDKKDNWPFDPFTYDRPINQAVVPQQSNGNDCGVFTLKFIECHALGIEFPQTLCHKNIPSIRMKLASDVFHETGCRGPVEREYPELD